MKKKQSKRLVSVCYTLTPSNCIIVYWSLFVIPLLYCRPFFVVSLSSLHYMIWFLLGLQLLLWHSRVFSRGLLLRCTFCLYVIQLVNMHLLWLYPSHIILLINSVQGQNQWMCFRLIEMNCCSHVMFSPIMCLAYICIFCHSQYCKRVIFFSLMIKFNSELLGLEVRAVFMTTHLLLRLVCLS